MRRFLKIQGILLFLILVGAAFLRLYKIDSLMNFMGDVAWDFLSAKRFLTQGQFPLVGIPSSVPWLRQGAFFTYFLIVVLGLFHLNPIAPAVFTAFFGIASTFLVYCLGKHFFSEKVGLWAALFYAFSPLSIVYDRFPYHLSLIAFFTIFFFLGLYQGLKGKVKYFFWSAFLAGVLLQFELSNLVLLPILIWSFWQERLKISFRLLVFSLVGFLIPWIPKIVYDFSAGFTQTIGFLAWIGHKILPLGPFLEIQRSNGFLLTSNLDRLAYYFSKIIFPLSQTFSLIILSSSFFLLLKERAKDRIVFRLCFLWLIFPILGFLIQGSPSESYLPVLFPLLALLQGFLLEKIGRKAIAMAFFFVLLNANFLIKQDFWVGSERYSSLREVADFIVKDAKEEKFMIIPLGNYAYFPANKLNLVYLTQMVGHGPSEQNAKLLYFVYYNNEEKKIKGTIFKKKFTFMTVARKDL